MDQIVAKTEAYFIIHQYKNDEDDTYGCEVLERLTIAKEDEYDDAFDGLEYELENHRYEDRYAVVKVKAELIKSYCRDFNCYEYDEELHIEEVNFDKALTDKENKYKG
ncbi:hypothetical protein [Priestia flexa]|uniref:hypothetical protein n=1 Tax=Priestia flexa TaxID=86664 RepID=UPI000473B378|nr:hypothetical protein [Priestia flexa]